MSSELISSIKLYHSTEYISSSFYINVFLLDILLVRNKSLDSVNDKKKQGAIFPLFYLTQFWILLFKSWLQEIKMTALKGQPVIHSKAIIQQYLLICYVTFDCN